MQIPLKVDFKDMEPSEFVEKRVRQRAEKLERLFDGIIGCEVTIEAPKRHPRRDNIYHVRIRVMIPGDDVIVSRHPGDMRAHTDVYVAIRDAFDAAERQLASRVERLRGDVKAHEAPPQGRVIRLFDDHGFILTTDGQEVYFHRNSVVETDFDALEVGQPVRLMIAEGESPAGPQATTVRPIRPLQVDPKAAFSK